MRPALLMEAQNIYEEIEHMKKDILFLKECNSILLYIKDAYVTLNSSRDIFSEIRDVLSEFLRSKLEIYQNKFENL